MARKILVIGSSGAGKALKDSEPVATINGWVNIGDIKEGDIVFDENGEETKVLNTYKYKEQVYRVFFDDNTYIDTCKDHRWKIGSKSYRGKQEFRVMTTSEVKTAIDERKNRGVKYNKFYIPTAKPVQYKKKDLIVDPYMLGLLLGDGCLTKKERLYFSNTEEDVINKLNSLVEKNYGNILFIKNEATPCQYVLKYTDDASVEKGKLGKLRKQLIVDLEKLDLIGTNSHSKFIPTDYLLSDIDDRLRLLKGLFDTDGSIRGVRKSFSTVSHKLMEGVVELANSLGIPTTIYEDKREGKHCYQISFFTDMEIWDSCKHSVKYAKAKADKKSNRCVSTNKIFIRNVELLDEVADMTCLEVESELHTFLTKGYKVTHNTTSLRNLDEKETAIIKCINKELPFKKGDARFKSIVCSKAEDVIKNVALILQKAPHIKNIVIDDLIYLSVDSFMARSKEKGYEKYTDLANELYSVMTLPDKIMNRDDLTFIFLTHSETNANSETNVRTIGKAISEKVVPEGLFTIVLEATVVDGEYKFLTHNITGTSIVKTPMEMFEDDYIDNDITLALKAIKEYY